MKIGFESFTDKYSLLKKTIIGLFTMSSAAGAQTIYQCAPCPSGQTSNPGATSVSQCYSPCSKSASSTIFSGTSNWSGTLQPGWYRISLRGASGDSVVSEGGQNRVCKKGKYNVEICAGGCTNCTGGSSDSSTRCRCTGVGAGAKVNFTFYVGVASSASFTYNSGSPKFTVTESGSTRTYTASKGGDATYTSDPKDVTVKNDYGSVTGKEGNVTCGKGSAGSYSYTPSTLFSSTDKNNSCSTSATADGLSSAGGKLVKL
ncbi:MAG: hypothetical protein K2M23_01035 [Alphaproteobacteria bacterium]|nr:hypothetical protein [Alphaproteobacteria bacterium]